MAHLAHAASHPLITTPPHRSEAAHRPTDTQ